MNPISQAIVLLLVDSINELANYKRWLFGITNKLQATQTAKIDNPIFGNIE